MKNIPSLRLRNFSLEASGRLEMDTALGGYLDSFTVGFCHDFLYGLWQWGWQKKATPAERPSGLRPMIS
ncbi:MULTISPECIES: hypothetical protein [Acidithiobacillus]|jgi:hypothetical protein|uniref:hypothetical protein n=1 Tax=Acidithiobacillus TaxID=119977 RepID=UPI000ADC1156|nr:MULTISPECIES: hypothetical protein [Acidithiobacillus]MBN6744594.1 hypothetical protein [Acidithiobacillus sp. MC2.2]MBN6747519.1 hypothetical protein [Acidithiobacillus sp. PG05]MBU2774043.1 hypothetical protein [Acidithiobacillus ferrooxidans]MBU2816668.1 hypothetical protein [Acidithiobacillus ferrooxidans]MCR0969629.1 hypothetical protein [Acidithiobacillus ferrooxidans]